MTRVRFGVLGVARIGWEKVIPAMQRGDYCEVVAIASRSLDKSKMSAERLGVARAHGSYEDLLADPDIDAVYNPLPNHLHVPWSIKALEAGKHVLCEKPIGLSSAEGQTLVEAGRKHPKLKLMEAFMYRHHPQWQAARRILSEGKIGTLKAIETFFSYTNRDPDNIRNQAEIGGGALMDIGCYPISLSRWLFDAEPTRVLGRIEQDPDFQVDRMTSATLDFGSGVSNFTVGTQLAPYQRVQIVGTEGRFEIEIPFNAPPNAPTIVHHQTAKGVSDTALAVCDQYTIQGDLFAQAILNDTPVPTPIEDAVANMRVIEAIRDSAESDTWVSL